MANSEDSILDRCTSDQAVEVRRLLEQGWSIDGFDGFNVSMSNGFAGMCVGVSGSKTTVGGYFALQSADT